MLVPLRLHWYVNPVPVLAFNITDPPVQMLVLPAAVIVAVGPEVTVTVMTLEVALPQLLVTTHV